MEFSDPPAIRDILETERSARPGFLVRLLAGGRRELLFWCLLSVFWAGIGLIGLLMTRAFRASIPDVELGIVVRVSSGFVLCAGLRGIFLQPWLRQQKRLAKWAMVAGCCLVFALFEMLMLWIVTEIGISIPGGVENFSLRLLVVRLFILGVWSTLYFAFHLIETEHALEMRAVRAELAARENELRHLQAQMNPHFLFNALNGVLACKNDPAAVEEVTRSLAEYLRFLLEETRPFEPLSRELDAIEKFLAVQTAHFSGNLACRIHWDSTVRPVMVPPMLIQPLLENAFHYRSEVPDQSLHMWLTAGLEQGFLRITLSNTGVRVPPQGDTVGTGIHALRQRLKLLLGSGARVVQETDGGWVRVTIYIPVPVEASKSPANPSRGQLAAR